LGGFFVPAKSKNLVECHQSFTVRVHPWGAAIRCNLHGAFSMTDEQNLDPEIHEDEDEYESLADYHRIAALHYSQAAKHHSLAADADDQGHEEARNSHVFLAYRHKLIANQYAEMAVIESDELTDDDSDEIHAD
jgi:hypothetical protein